MKTINSLVNYVINSESPATPVHPPSPFDRNVNVFPIPLDSHLFITARVDSNDKDEIIHRSYLFTRMQFMLIQHIIVCYFSFFTKRHKNRFNVEVQMSLCKFWHREWLSSSAPIIFFFLQRVGNIWWRSSHCITRTPFECCFDALHSAIANVLAKSRSWTKFFLRFSLFFPLDRFFVARLHTTTNARWINFRSQGTVCCLRGEHHLRQLSRTTITCDACSHTQT